MSRCPPARGTTRCSNVFLPCKKKNKKQKKIPTNVISRGLCHFVCSLECSLAETPVADAAPLNPGLQCLCCVRYDSQARGVPGGKHGEARPPLQSLQDEPPPQVRERGGTAALHGQTGKWTSTRDLTHSVRLVSCPSKASGRFSQNSTNAITNMISDQKLPR